MNEIMDMKLKDIFDNCLSSLVDVLEEIIELFFRTSSIFL